ncbi:uncharacterized protein [Ptychodera flava]|uniref:uncharacterized protein isoform X2 n=1 Tax=Ptychodera flava TaxID=63121 RepID=UPI00396A136E
MQIAIDHHNMVLIQKCFTPWKEITQDTVQEKQRLADEMYNCILVRRALASWRRYGHLQSIQLQKARRHYSYTTKSNREDSFQCMEEIPTGCERRRKTSEEDGRNEKESSVYTSRLWCIIAFNDLFKTFYT